MPGAIIDDAAMQADSANAAPERPCEDYIVVYQAVDLEVNFREKSIQGKTIITVFPLNSSLDTINLDARQCEIDLEGITVNDKKVKAEYNDPYRLLKTPQGVQWAAEQFHIRQDRIRPLRVSDLPDLPVSSRERYGCTPVDGSLRISLRPEAQRPTLKVRLSSSAADLSKSVEPKVDSAIIVVPFRTRCFRDGLQFVGLDVGDMRYPHVYTRHSVAPGTASCIFPCVDDPGSRCAWKVSIKCPRTLGYALEQPLATQQASVNGTGNSHKRQQDSKTSKPRDFGLSEEDKLLEMTVICSGNLTDEVIDPEDERKKIMVFECEQPAAAQHIGFAVGPFEHVDLWSQFRNEEDDETLGQNAVKIHGYCLPGRVEEVQNACATIAPAADFFAFTFGKYPFDSYKLCFVDDMVADTVPLYSLSLCSTRILYPDSIIDLEFDVTRKLVHSLASQWSGIHIVPDQTSDTWLVVGIAYYMTDLFLKKLCGNNDYRFRIKAMTDRLVELDVGRPSLHDLGKHLHLGHFEMDFMAFKAPLVLFVLDKRLVKASGNAGSGLNRIWSKLVSKANISSTGEETVIASETFKKLCEKVSHYRLDSFWDQYIHKAGCPRFTVTSRFNKKRLAVETMIKQVHFEVAAKWEANGQELNKDDFWRDIKEKFYEVQPGDMQVLFTGPMTIRIHEADGTPYEHIVELREDARKGASFQIPYNTKYKRLKRNRRARERAMENAGTSNLDINADNKDDVLLYCLGDVLTGDEEEAAWGFQDWDPEISAKMDQESYEWIRVDADFEWLGQFQTDMEIYMKVSQLQQDRDVVAQQDTMLVLKDKPPHPVPATICTRTLLDRRYFHRIRTMAVDILPNYASGEITRIVQHHLLKSYSELFCGADSTQPLPNDFSDKRQYYVRCAIPGAVARIRVDGKCPARIRLFLLQQLRFNNNANNEYSDHFFVAKLLEALATCLVPDQNSQPNEISFDFDDGEDPIASKEEQEFLEQAVEEFERYRRMDEWTGSFHNIWTTTALDCKKRLMKAGVIETDPVAFAQYLQDECLDLVRIKAFECLVELKMLEHPHVLKLLLHVMSTDNSPFVRDRLFQVFTRGLASIAFGEHEEKEAKKVDDDGDLVVEDVDNILAAKKSDLARVTNISSAIKELKKVTKDNKELQRAMWKAVESPALGLAEQRNLLDLCGILFEADDALLVTMKLPMKWTVRKAPEYSKKRPVLIFSSEAKKPKPREKVAPPVPAEVPPPVARPAVSKEEVKLPKVVLNVNNISRSNSISVKSANVPAASVSTPKPQPKADSISVLSKTKAIGVAQPPVTNGASPSTPKPPASSKKVKAPKRKTEEDNNPRPSKKSKIVTLRNVNYSKLAARTRRQIDMENIGNKQRLPSTSGPPKSIAVARAPAAAASASGSSSKKERKPLPSAPTHHSSPPPSKTTTPSPAPPVATPASKSGVLKIKIKKPGK